MQCPHCGDERTAVLRTVNRAAVRFPLGSLILDAAPFRFLLPCCSSNVVIRIQTKHR